ncbi:uncharacterized protein BXZ73DRAFT_63165 [Epithele typhae]|uniref:uncharacterized protein n=1 Tax=Epithele typhae TaxID=378194 RepID=UPI002008A6CD|nr:uncharacterized protein BXZ73DRAFT_63165 [Epithele typhae]KAH9893896.1 hypothetical protein BXZ73DRAFT_63165 [Epithele typhae]
MNPIPTTSAEWLAQHESLSAKWERLVKEDPRRAVRVLLLHGVRDETIEGDTGHDLSYVIGHLRKMTFDAKSQDWRAMVDAGVMPALLKAALSVQGMIIPPGPNAPNFEVDAAVQMTPTPYFPILEILCNAICSCSIPPGPTELKMAEEIKKSWSAIMQRVWSEPGHSLDPQPERIRLLERIVVPQIVSRLPLIDPSFIEVIFKTSDLTLAVIFRYWIHSTSVADSRMNGGVLLYLLDKPVDPHPWKDGLEAYPPPPFKELLARIYLGASKTAGSNKKKRTPLQAAEAILAAFVRHFTNLSLDEVSVEYNFFHAFFDLCLKENRPFVRATYKSESFWKANADVMRRAAETPVPQSPAVFLAGLTTYSTMSHPVQEDGKEFIDAMTYNWISSGIFDILDKYIDRVIAVGRGPMIMTGILAAFERYLPKLTDKTKALLRSQLPRPRMTKRLLVSGTMSTDEERQRLQNAYSDFVQNGFGADPRSVIWLQGAWQMLGIITAKVEDPTQCARRGCALDAEPGDELTCKLCNKVRYCSQDCLKR